MSWRERGLADGAADALLDAAADQKASAGDAGGEAGATGDATIAEGRLDATTVTDAGAEATALLDTGDAGDAGDDAACVGATDTGLVQNGDFCEGLAGWTQVAEDAGSFSGYPHFVISAAPWCNAEPTSTTSWSSDRASRGSPCSGNRQYPNRFQRSMARTRAYRK